MASEILAQKAAPSASWRFEKMRTHITFEGTTIDCEKRLPMADNRKLSSAVK
jgi:hypothetical protein